MYQYVSIVLFVALTGTFTACKTTPDSSLMADQEAKPPAEAYLEEYKSYQCPILQENPTFEQMLKTIEFSYKNANCSDQDLAKMIEASGKMRSAVADSQKLIADYEAKDTKQRISDDFQKQVSDSIQRSALAITQYESALASASCRAELENSNEFLTATVALMTTAAPFMQLAGPQGMAVGTGTYLVANAITSLQHFHAERRQVDFKAQGEEIKFARHVCQYMQVQKFLKKVVIYNTNPTDHRSRGFAYSEIMRRMDEIEVTLFGGAGFPRRDGLVMQWLNYVVSRTADLFEDFKEIARRGPQTKASAEHGRLRFSQIQSTIGSAIEVCDALLNANLIATNFHNDVYEKCFYQPQRKSRIKLPGADDRRSIAETVAAISAEFPEYAEPMKEKLRSN